MKMRLQLAIATLALLTLAAGIPERAGAQMVPRLVSYPRNTIAVAACAFDPATALSNRRTIEYAHGTWRETLAVFGDRTCAPESALFTVSAGGRYEPAAPSPWNVAYRTITPTPIGTAYLQQQCGQYAWSAGVVQSISDERCGSLALLR
jgi:hypothetical protein